MVDYGGMPRRHVVVDGSNIATEGRSLPSLAQLDEAVRAFQAEFPDAEITVVVDATFGHRIDESERASFEEAEAHGEVVSPPAGAIGRGDAFLLLIAEKTGAVVLSNDSFQEFHGEHEWLFDKGRLVGGKPVPGVGWIFTPRSPVRGQRSKQAMKEARMHRVRVGSKEASQPMPVPTVPPPPPPGQAGKEAGTGTRAAPARDAKVRKAIAAATKEVEAPDSTTARRRRHRRGAGPPPPAVNDPLPFITFIAEHSLGSQVEGEVESFTSHGAFVTVDGARGYVPLSGLGDPPPTKARAVLSKGEHRRFVLQALDPQRRGIELALPEFAQVAGTPSEETVKAEIAGTAKPPKPKRVRGAKAQAAEAELAKPAPEVRQDDEEGEAVAEKAPARRASRRKKAADGPGSGAEEGEAGEGRAGEGAAGMVPAEKGQARAGTKGSKPKKAPPAENPATAEEPAAGKKPATAEKAAASRRTRTKKAAPSSPAEPAEPAELPKATRRRRPRAADGAGPA